MQGRTETFSRWRVGVCGTSRNLPPGSAEFCQAIGKALGRRDTVIVVHSGLKRQAEQKTFAADWHFIQGVRQAVEGPLEDRVETIVSGLDQDGLDAPTNAGDGGSQSRSEMFIEGRVRHVRGKTREARRFAFANSLDAIIGLGGGYGTSQLLTLAFALDIPVLPVPCFEGKSRIIWTDHKPDLVRAFNIQNEVHRWETQPSPPEEADALAEAMVRCLLTQIPRRAFVIMPFSSEFDTLFDLVIEPVLNSVGDEILRLDRNRRAGNVTEQIEDGIRACDYAVAVLDGWRPNVLYELGYTKALKKPVILLFRRDQARSLEDVPFDISTLQRGNMINSTKDFSLNLPVW